MVHAQVGVSLSSILQVPPFKQYESHISTKTYNTKKEPLCGAKNVIILLIKIRLHMLTTLAFFAGVGKMARACGVSSLYHARPIILAIKCITGGLKKSKPFEVFSSNHIKQKIIFMYMLQNLQCSQLSPK